MKAVTLLVLSVIFVLQVNAALRPAATKKSTNFDFYVFASEWAGSICNVNSCGKADSEGASPTFWNIHGLWPSDGKQGINYCTQEKFDPSRLANQKQNLATYWSGLYSSADAFHGHEWEKHGTCSNMNQETYFAKTMELARGYDVYGTLARRGIVTGGIYDCDTIARAIRTEYNVDIITLSSKNGYLTELFLCVDKDFKPRDCASGKVCKGLVRYPKLNL